MLLEGRFLLEGSGLCSPFLRPSSIPMGDTCTGCTFSSWRGRSTLPQVMEVVGWQGAYTVGCAERYPVAESSDRRYGGYSQLSNSS